MGHARPLSSKPLAGLLCKADWLIDSMRITIITIGSRGDVQPYLALGLGLHHAGHDVCLATHITFEPLIREQGLEFAPVKGDIRQLIESGSIQDIFDTGRNSILFSRRFMRSAEPLVLQSVMDMLEACRGAELIILAGIGFYGGYDVATKLGTPFIQAALQPVVPTRSFQSVFFPPPSKWLPLKGKYNQLTHIIFRQTFWYFVRGPLNKARREVLDLPPAPIKGPFDVVNDQHSLMLLGYSPTVLPKPKEWGPWLHVTGYWFLDHPLNWKPSNDLVDFLESGPPPVYVGFGSMSNRDPEETTALVLDALTSSKQRGVLLTGWGGLHQSHLPDTVINIDAVPHDWLFPRVAAVVHHGGAGTTAAGLRAGVPSIVVPFFGDQFFWGQRVAALGVGPQPISRKKLTSSKLANTIIEAVNNEHIQLRSSEIGTNIRAEDGVQKAVGIINEYIDA